GRLGRRPAGDRVRRGRPRTRGRRDRRGRRRRRAADRGVPREPEDHLSRRLDMALSKIWVYAEASDGKVSPTTLELLTKARSLADTVEAVFAGDGAAVAGELGEYGASAVLATGDLTGKLPGVPVAAALAAAIEGGNAPDAIF